MTEPTIGPGMRIALHFALTLEDGSEIDSTFGRKPAQCVFGDGNLLPGFEKHLLGLPVGAAREFTVPPEDAFGQPNPANVQRFERRQFSVDTVLEPGVVLSFADAQRAELPGVVQSVAGDEVLVDFNHPLAGRTLLFRVHILDIEPVS